MTIRKAFKFKLQPTTAQERQLWQFCGAVRWVWNRMLAQRSETYKATGKSPNAHAQIVQLPTLKQQVETAWLSDVHSQVLQNAVLDLEDAFTRFFTRQNGYPRFKKKHGRKQSFTYPQGVKVDGGSNGVASRVFLPKIGWMRFRLSREMQGAIKRVTVSHRASVWYVSFNCEIEHVAPGPLPVTLENSIGLDLGSIDLITTSDGVKVANPRLYRRAEKQLRRAQKSRSRKKRDSNRYGGNAPHVTVNMTAM